MKRLLITSVIAAALVAVTGPVFATGYGGTTGSNGSNSSTGNNSSTGADTSVSSDHEIYGSEIMTPEERAEFRSKMQSAKTSQERERLRIDHQAAMKSRAKQRGITLPDDPSVNPSPDSGMGTGGTP